MPDLVLYSVEACHPSSVGCLVRCSQEGHGLEFAYDAAARLTAMQWSGLEQGASLPDMLDSLPGGSAANTAGIANPTRPPQAMLGALTSKQYHYDSLGQMVGIQTPVGMSASPMTLQAASQAQTARTPACSAGSLTQQATACRSRDPAQHPR